MGKIFIFLALFILSLALTAPAVFAAPNPAPTQKTAAPATAADLFARAQTEAAAGYNDTAREHLLKAQALDPKNINILKLLGDVEYRLQRYAAAEVAYKAVLAAQPNNKDVHNRLGGVYAAEDRFNDAVGEFNKSLPSPEAIGNLIELYFDQGRLGELEAQFQLDVTHDPYDPDHRYNLGSVLEREGKFAEAISQYQQAIAMQPRFTDAYNALGKAYGETDRYQDAIKQYKIAIGQDSKYYYAWMNWGVELIRLGDPKSAIDKINKALEISPRYWLAYLNLGVAYDSVGEFTRAVELSQRAISLEPRQRLAYLYLGVLYKDHNLLNLAEAALIKGLAISMHNPDLHYYLGQVYEQEHKYDLAAAQYKAVIQTQPNYPEARQALAALEALNKR